MTRNFISIVIGFGLSISAFASSWNPYLGIEGGWLKKSTDLPSEIDKTGFIAGLKAMMNWHSESWTADMGLGWKYSKISGADPFFNIKIETRAGFAELAARYKIGGFQFGVVTDAWFGQVSFSETGEPNKNVAFLIGPQFVYDFAEMPSDLQFRVGLKGFTDIDISDRQIMGAVLELHFGFPRSEQPPPEAVVEPEPVVAMSAPKYEEVNQTSVRFTLDDYHVHFALGKADVAEDARQFLGQFSTFLMNRENEWKQVDVDGHADVRGSEGFNEQLSLRRAEQVAVVLSDFGIADKRIRIKGYGFTKQIDSSGTEEGHSKNRRVEITVNGVADMSKFQKDMQTELGLVAKSQGTSVKINVTAPQQAAPAAGSKAAPAQDAPSQDESGAESSSDEWN